MAVLVGFSISEALMCPPGLLFDMVELKAMQSGQKRLQD